MANLNAIQISATLKYSANKAAASLSTTFSDDQAGDKYQAGVQSVGTTEEELDKGDVGTIGYLAIRNMDQSNFVQLGAATGAYSFEVPAGKGAVLPWKSANVFIKADTAAVEVEYLIIEA